MAEITLEQLTKVYPDGTKAVTELDLEVEAGEFVVFVGPSGCGKTTALRMVAGLETVTSGNVKIDGQVVNDLPPKDRDIAMVFQNYALYPHMTASRNMGFALKMQGVPKGEIDRRVREAARILGLTDSLQKKPRTLSGGQRQRVAMGRAIVRNPQAFLMDEPLSNLDAKLRVEMRAEIARIQRDLGVTTVYVTHDQIEAMTMGDRCAVMRNGLLQQVDTPQVLYERPRNLFVAEFIGSPAMNLVVAELAREDGALWAHFGEHRLRLAETTVTRNPGLERFEGRSLALGIRPEDMEDASLVSNGASGSSAVCRLRHPRGHGLRGLRALQHRGSAGRDEGSARGDTSSTPPRTQRRRSPPSRRAGEVLSSSRGSTEPRARRSRKSSSWQSTSNACTSSTRRPASRCAIVTCAPH